MSSAIKQASQAGVGYSIRIRGIVGDALLGAFPELRPEYVDGDTLLIGQVADQAALHGMLAQIEALSLELVELYRSDRVTTAHPAAADRDDNR